MLTYIPRTLAVSVTLLGLLGGLPGCVAEPPIDEQSWPNGYDEYLDHGRDDQGYGYSDGRYRDDTYWRDRYPDDSSSVSTHLYLGYGPTYLYEDPPIYYYPAPRYYPERRHHRVDYHRPPPDRRDDNPWNRSDRNHWDRDRDRGDRDRNDPGPADQRPHEPNPDRRPPPRNGGDGPTRPTPPESPGGGFSPPPGNDPGPERVYKRDVEDRSSDPPVQAPTPHEGRGGRVYKRDDSDLR